ncbi:MAG: hypothetical protein M1822_006795 [Bathelium mastoideum]|nr:MAG: hypothetical protein M1822_006795 [Bathelium mastoideum]
MCGISCIVALSGTPVPKRPEYTSLENDLRKSLNTIRHRGPDAIGTWSSRNKRVGLGHARLAINDLSPAGEQPFVDKDGVIAAVVNGELYDHESIRARLSEETGVEFQSTSDCEIVIALYKRYGLSFLDHLRGEFALCLYDATQECFIAVRDRYGIKPLFYTIQNGRLLVAAEAKAFLPLGWRPEWDVKSLFDGGWNFDDRTLFRDVRKVRPGHYLHCRRLEAPEQRMYWDMEYPNKSISDPRSEDELIQAVREHMLDSIRLRLRADVPVGVYLSGGIDSSAIAGMVTHLVKERGEKVGNSKETDKVSCFSIAFDEDSGFDESSIANRTAEYLGVKYYKKHMNEAELAKHFEEATWHIEHYYFDLNYVGKFSLSELTRECGFKVVLTGEGADEHFAGYPVYLPDYLRERDPSLSTLPLPESVRVERCEQAEKELAKYYNSIGAHMHTEPDTRARRMLNGISTPSSMTAFSIESLFAPWVDEWGVPQRELTIAENIDGRAREQIANKWHPLHSAQYTWIKGHLTNSFLSCLGDRTEMAHSIEARTPFLDHVFTAYVNGLPPSVKMRWVTEEEAQKDKAGDMLAGQKGAFVEKWILRKAVRPFITDELYKRRKHPYSAPTTYPENGPLHKLLQRLVTKENVEELGFLHWEKTKNLVHRAFVEKDALAMRLAFSVAQFVVLSERFGISRAESGRALF